VDSKAGGRPEIVAAIKAVLKDGPFLGEGHRKVTARLRQRGMRIGKNRILRLMRQEGLLAPVRRGHPHGDRSQSGTITPEEPNALWGTDATRFYPRQQGWCWFFGAIDHHVADIVGWHVAKKGDRWAALEPIRHGVRDHSWPTPRGSPWDSDSGTTGARSTRRISSPASWPGSGSARLRRSWASPSATASWSAGSERSRRVPLPA
jgi:hypothetical protein